ncbi:hypothetical protein J6590_072108 [Homalodisca vitripennis]|nr:hypothetical protein J6590_072108 [Homalodisca vitripennis]
MSTDTAEFQTTAETCGNMSEHLRPGTSTHIRPLCRLMTRILDYTDRVRITCCPAVSADLMTRILDYTDRVRITCCPAVSADVTPSPQPSTSAVSVLSCPPNSPPHRFQCPCPGFLHHDLYFVVVPNKLSVSHREISLHAECSKCKHLPRPGAKLKQVVVVNDLS